jgi:predicted nuclease of predicted toxin-antitoxin system
LWIADWLRANGHDVGSAGELSPGSPDKYWLQFVNFEARLILTSDKDFGELVFGNRQSSLEIVLLRLDSLPMAKKVQRLCET